jgi:hypothetical protein
VNLIFLYKKLQLMKKETLTGKVQVYSAINLWNCSQVLIMKPRPHSNKNVSRNNFSSLTVQSKYLTLKGFTIYMLFRGHKIVQFFLFLGMNSSIKC